MKPRLPCCLVVVETPLLLLSGRVTEQLLCVRMRSLHGPGNTIDFFLLWYLRLLCNYAASDHSTTQWPETYMQFAKLWLLCHTSDKKCPRIHKKNHTGTFLSFIFNDTGILPFSKITSQEDLSFTVKPLCVGLTIFGGELIFVFVQHSVQSVKKAQRPVLSPSIKYSHRWQEGNLAQFDQVCIPGCKDHSTK